MVKLGLAKDLPLAGRFQSEALTLSQPVHPRIGRLVDYNSRRLPPYYVLERVAKFGRVQAQIRLEVRARIW